VEISEKAKLRKGFWLDDVSATLKYQKTGGSFVNWIRKSLGGVSQAD
jgi:hypothetical protein